MNVWHLLLVFEMALCAVVVVFLFFSWYRKSRAVAKAHSREHRLKIPNVWTDIQHVHHNSSSQTMRLKDGNFVMVTVGAHSSKILVGSQPGPPEKMAELMSFPVSRSGKGRRQYQAEILDELKKKVGLPDSAEELRLTARGLQPPEQLAKA